MYSKTLPYTGAGLVVGGYALNQLVLIGAALALVVLGAIAVRFGFRRGQGVGE